jgi:hypothetical protein
VAIPRRIRAVVIRQAGSETLELELMDEAWTEGASTSAWRNVRAAAGSAVLRHGMVRRSVSRRSRLATSPAILLRRGCNRFMGGDKHNMRAPTPWVTPAGAAWNPSAMRPDDGARSTNASWPTPP